ncbi:hypothetical protein B5X24_HaOG215887 [Helicoverpa armigera]|uniref:Uncharacterized protein n=1 Tax=Helicoverpa armigera TaxID=29058 RepID=A0A2W1BC40_HELAM|nr:hypothetical protein B5X24_HaOG215887 [Helicoverpa armigera]
MAVLSADRIKLMMANAQKEIEERKRALLAMKGDKSGVSAAAAAAQQLKVQVQQTSSIAPPSVIKPVLYSKPVGKKAREMMMKGDKSGVSAAAAAAQQLKVQVQQTSSIAPPSVIKPVLYSKPVGNALSQEELEKQRKIAELQARIQRKLAARCDDKPTPPEREHKHHRCLRAFRCMGVSITNFNFVKFSETHKVISPQPGNRTRDLVLGSCACDS